MGRARSLRAVGWPRLDAALFAAAPRRLPAVARRPEEVPPAAQQDARSPRIRRDGRRRDHHRTARPGLRQRGRLRDRSPHGGRALPEPAAAEPRLRHRRRRRPDGRHQLRSGDARRPPAARQPRVSVGRQRHHDRRPYRPRHQRRHRQALRGAGLVGAARRRPRRRAGAQGTRLRLGGTGDRQAAADLLQDDDRQGQPEQGEHARSTRRPARQGRDHGDQEGTRHAARGLLRRPRGEDRVRRCCRPQRAGAPAVARRHDGVGAEERRPGEGLAQPARAHRAGRSARAAGGRRRRRARRDARVVRQRAEQGRRAGAGFRLRQRRPRSVDQDAHQEERLVHAQGPHRPHAALRHPRARHGRHPERHHAARRLPAGTCARRSAWRR